MAFGNLNNVGSFLDFAAGYGRSTRFWDHVPPKGVVIAEIQAEALAFQARELNVSTIQSTTVRPAALRVDRAFDFVFVASLFTHLPDRTFGSWLAKMWQFVSPNGVLVFSVHDEAVNESGVELQDGFAFIPLTEVPSLSVDDYGGNLTTEEYVRRRLREAVGAEAANAVRLPRALCFHQDVGVVPRGRVSEHPLQYDRGPQGSVDQLTVDGRTLRLTGWAADIGFAGLEEPGHAISDLQVYVNGTELRSDLQLGLPRPDVAAYLKREDDPLASFSGWTASWTRRAVRDTDVISVVVNCEHGTRYVLDSATIRDALPRIGGGDTGVGSQRRLRELGARRREAPGRSLADTLPLARLSADPAIQMLLAKPRMSELG